MNRSNGILYYVNMDKMIIDVQIIMIKKRRNPNPICRRSIEKRQLPRKF